MPSQYIRRGSHYFLPARPCVSCGTEFEPRVGANPAHGLYCGRSCANKVNRQQRAPWGVDGHRTIEPGRYVRVRMPSHPAATGTGYVYEHRLVVEKRLGRYLREDEQIHHINGDKTDNRDENLEVLTKAEHLKKHRAEYEEKRLRNLRAAYTKKSLAHKNRASRANE